MTETGSAAATWPRAILHLDMDAFYVNVHVLDHPEDADIPLAIGGKPNQRGVVASASYAARSFGVRSAMPTSTAVRLCPALKLAPANWARIRECSAQVMAILADFGPLEQMSVDEAYLDLSEQADPVAVANVVKTAVKSQTQLPCSVGLATSKLVAKVASDHDKPEGFTIVSPGSEAAFLAPLPTRALHGVGPRTTEKLAALAIHTCADLAQADPLIMRRHFGKHGPIMVNRARGLDPRRVKPDRGPAKSISQEWTFNRDVNDADVLLAQLQKMTASIAKSLQKRSLVAHTVFVKFRWADFTTFTRQKSLEIGMDQEEEIARVAAAIWEEHWPPGQRMRLLGVGVSNLEEPASRQLGFDFLAS